VSRDLLAVLDRGYRMVWRENDTERALRDLDAEFESTVPGHREGAVRAGPQETIAFLREWLEPWEELHGHGRVTRMAPYPDLDEARRAAGL
jgi:hypothetical protein